jgi:hypothetical protein
MSWSSQYKDFLHVDFIYSMVYSGHRLNMFHCIYYRVMLITPRSTVSASTDPLQCWSSCSLIYSHSLASLHSRCNDCRIHYYINFTLNNYCISPNNLVSIDVNLSPHTECYIACLYRYIMPHGNLSTTMDGIYWIYEKISSS